MAERKSTPDEIADLRAATREAHEAIKDMRTLMKELRALKDEVTEVAGTVFEERMQAQVVAGLESYREAIEQAVEEATKAMDRRFDTIGAILLGEDGDGPLLADLARDWRSRNPKP